MLLSINVWQGRALSRTPRHVTRGQMPLNLILR